VPVSSAAYMREQRVSNEEYKGRERVRLRERQAKRRAEDPRGEYLKREIRKNKQRNRRDEEVLRGYTEAEA
jgi:hypothetical protein